MPTQMRRVWQHASEDLNFRFVSPFVLRDGDSERECFGFLPDFGSTRGLVVLTDHASTLWQLAQAQGVGFSCLTSSDAPYDRDSFIDMLNDWGWHGPSGQAPAWYTGKPWTE
jgi:hypothetical protein